MSPLPVPITHSVVMKWSGSVASIATPCAPPSKLLWRTDEYMASCNEQPPVPMPPIFCVVVVT